MCLCVTEWYPFAGEAVRSWSVGVRKQFRQTGFSLLFHPVTVGHSEQVHSIAIQRVAQQLPMIIHTAWGAVRERGWRSVNQKLDKLEGQGKIQVMYCVCVLPARTELSSAGVALVKLLQHLLTLTIGEWEAEGEVGGRPSRLQQPVSE